MNTDPEITEDPAGLVLEHRIQAEQEFTRRAQKHMERAGVLQRQEEADKLRVDVTICPWVP